MKPRDWQYNVGKLCTNDGGNTVYRVVGYCEQPTVTLEDIDTKERSHFAIGSLMASDFEKLYTASQLGPYPQDTVEAPNA